MGGKSSKTDHPTYTCQTEERRRSRKSISKIETVDTILSFVQTVKIDIENYKGFREDEPYKTLQMLLAKSSQELQVLKSMMKKDKLKSCDRVQKEINICLRLLEEKVHQNERDLDEAAIESHSFINQQVTSKQKKFLDKSKKSYQTINQLEDSIIELEKSINTAIETENKVQFLFLEKKIHILYTDLEMITADSHTPLYEQKEYLGRQLIKYNNRLKKAKHTENRKSPTLPIDDTLSRNTTIQKIQKQLQTLEAEVTSFGDTKNSSVFKKIKNDLNNCWNKLHEMKNEEDSIKKTKQQLVEKIKHVLSILKERAIKNEAKFEFEKRKLREIQTDIDNIEKLIESGSKTSLEYFEETLNNLAEEIKNTMDDFEELRAIKENLLENLERIHKRLEKEDEKSINEDGFSKEKKELEGLCKKLHNSLDNLNAIDEDNFMELKAVVDGISKKIEAITEKGKETTETPKENKLELQNGNIFLVNISFTYILLISVEKKVNIRDSMDNILDFLIEAENELENRNTRESFISTTEFNTFEEETEVDSKINTNEKTLQSIMDVDAKIQELSKEISEFSGSKKDKQYLEIRDSLETCSSILYSIPESNRENITTAKREVLEQIFSLHSDLKNKLKQNANIDQNDFVQVKEIIDQVKSLKKRVDCFTGLHKNTLYIQIEESLNLQKQKLHDLTPNIKNAKLKLIVEQTKTKITQYLQILDEKSIKATHHQSSAIRHSITYDSYKQLEEIRNTLLRIKVDMESYNGTKKHDTFDKLTMELMNCDEKLENIPEVDSNSVKASKEQYTKYIKDLLRYFEEKTPNS